MKICPLCHTENEEDAIYCKKCAHPFYEDSNPIFDTCERK